jgi:hypothetical protein
MTKISMSPWAIDNRHATVMLGQKLKFPPVQIIAVHDQAARRSSHLNQVLQNARAAWNRRGIPHAPLVEQLLKWPVAVSQQL